MFTIKNILRANATSCFIFGLIFLLLPLQTSMFLAANDEAPELVIQLLGVILLLNTAHLIWTSLQVKLNKHLILYFALGDFIWVIISLFLLINALWITTILGMITTLIVAIIVGTFGLLQFMKAKNM